MIDKSEITEQSDKIENYTMGLIREYSSGLNRFFLITAMFALLLLLAVLWFIVKGSVKKAKEFAAPIQMLTDGTVEIAKGNLEKKLSIRTGDELETLAENFNRMTEELSAHVENLAKSAAKRERIETELSVATKIQAGMLPKVDAPFLGREDFELAALMHPAREVGGDFYDFYLLDGNHLVVTVADVSDKGVPAALFMAISKTVLKENLLYNGNPGELGAVFEATNDTLAASNDADMFVTVFTGVLDTKTGEFVYVNAGHNPPVIKGEGRCEYLPKPENTIIGFFAGLSYQAGSIRLKRGDMLFLYTDGVTEARNAQKEFFGNGRLLEVAENFSGNAENDVGKAYGAVNAYAGDAVQSDDITMLALVYK